MTLAPFPLIRSRPRAAAAGLAVGYGNPARGEPETILPTTYAQVNVIVANAAWAAWTEITAGEASDLVLLAAHIAQIYAVTAHTWYQLGVGAAGSESVIAEFGQGVLIAGSGAAPIVPTTYHLEPYTLPAGTRLAIRGQNNYAAVGAAACGLFVSCIPPSPTATWEDWSDDYIGGSQATNRTRYPAVAGWLTIGVGWTQVTAAAPNDMLVVAAELDPQHNINDAGMVVEVGTGAAGFEVAHTRIGIPRAGTVGWPFGMQEAGRAGLVNAGERVAARIVSGTGNKRGAVYFEDL